jgi:hypothetical protein
MTDGLTPKAPGRVRGRPFEQGRSGNPLGRRLLEQDDDRRCFIARGRGRGFDPQGG